MKLRKIIYTPAKGWIASFHGKQIEKDGRKTYEPDVKVRADSYEELLRELKQNDPYTPPRCGNAVEAAPPQSLLQGDGV